MILDQLGELLLSCVAQAIKEEFKLKEFFQEL